MTRLLSTIIWDAQLQWRYGFYYAGGFVAVIWITLFSLIPKETLAYFIPALLFLNLIMTTFYFVGGLVLLEKGQRTLEGLVVTPLQRGEYLAAKAITLSLLALLESVLIVTIGYGIALNWASLLLGLALLSVIYVLLGFVAISRYDSINEYLLPSVLVVMVLALPLIDYFDIWRSSLFYLLPTQPALILMRGAFEELKAGQAAYAVIFGLIWIAISYWLCRRAFYRFIVQHIG